MTLAPLLDSTALYRADVSWNTSSELSGYGSQISGLRSGWDEALNAWWDQVAWNSLTTPSGPYPTDRGPFHYGMPFSTRSAITLKAPEP